MEKVTSGRDRDSAAMDATDASWAAAVRRLRHHLFVRELEPIRDDLFAHCVGLTHDRADAEDLLQDTLLRGLGPIGQIYGAPHNPKAYLCKIARNLWIDRRRKHVRERRVLERSPNADDTHSRPTPGDIQAYLSFLSDTLPPREFEVFLLREIYGYSGAETARMLDVSDAAVKMAASRARKRIRESRGWIEDRLT